MQYVSKYSAIFQFWSLMNGNFFEKISQFSKRFPEIFQLIQHRKTIIFVPKLVLNQYMDQSYSWGTDPKGGGVPTTQNRLF